MLEFHDDMTLKEARGLLRFLRIKGHPCPCCGQLVKVYRWSLYSTAARLLIAIYRAGGTTEFIESKTVKSGLRPNVTPAELKHWSLVEHDAERRDDGGKSGWWRVTPHGEAFLLCRATIPKYAYVFDGRVLRYDGEQVTIVDVLGKKFNYRELMNA